MATILRMGSRGREVVKLQQLLNAKGAMPTLSDDGIFGQRTENAVKAFQSRQGLTADGIVGQKTWRKLGVTDIVEQAPPTASIAQTGEGFCFPFNKMPANSWRGGRRYFGAERDDGKRLHAGCDLIFPAGTAIYAVSDGVLVRGPYHFYHGTDAIEVRHGSILVRYCEIQQGSYCGKKNVSKGEVIAKVGLMSGGSHMLHIEIYANGTNSGALTIKGQGPYGRRSDITDPDPYLTQWSKNLPG